MQIVLPPEVEDLVQRQLASGKYQTALEVILAGVKLLEQQEDIYQGRLQELQQKARIGWEAVQRDQLLNGTTAMAQIRANLRDRYCRVMTPQFRLTEPAIRFPQGSGRN